MNFCVPEKLMVPIGAAATAGLGKCADSWSDSEVAELRVQLPVEYHAVPVDALRRQWINIRKRGTEGYRVSGKGPSIGSRIKARKKKTPQWYLDYLDSPGWKQIRHQWFDFWKGRCALCNSPDASDIHHRTYANVPHNELLTDCILLCRPCHNSFHAERDVEESGEGRFLLDTFSAVR